MKNFKTISLIALIISFTACTSIKGEEGDSATKEFSELADEEGFAEKHDEPRELELDEEGKMEKLKVKGGEDANIYRINREGSNNFLVVIHEWWGLNDHILKEADMWYEKLGNTNVIALDLYDGKVATTREKATEYMKGAQEDRIRAIINSTLNSLPKDANIATIGWCFGGGWSLKTAIAGGDRTKACVMYYGMPTKDMSEIKKISSDVLFIYGVEDEWINEGVATHFEAKMKEAGKKVSVLAFEADHAFANPSSERYVEAAAQEANQRALEYLVTRLK